MGKSNTSLTNSWESTTPAFESRKYFTVAILHSAIIDLIGTFRNEATAIELSENNGSKTLHHWVSAIPLRSTNSMAEARHPAIECSKYFTVVVHRSAEVDLIGLPGMGLRLSVESIDVSNDVKRHLETMPA
jgi:hypothetical protein